MSYNEYDINKDYLYYYDNYTRCFPYEYSSWELIDDGYEAWAKVQLKPCEENLPCSLTLNADNFYCMPTEEGCYADPPLDYILILLIAFFFLPVPCFC